MQNIGSQRRTVRAMPSAASFAAAAMASIRAIRIITHIAGYPGRLAKSPRLYGTLLMRGFPAICGRDKLSYDGAVTKGGGRPLAAETRRETVRQGLAELPLVVPCDYIPRIQEVQASMYHVMLELMAEETA